MKITIYNKIIFSFFAALFIQACSNKQTLPQSDIEHCVTGVIFTSRDTTIHDSKSRIDFSIEVNKSALYRYKNGQFWLVYFHNDTIHTTGLNTLFFPSDPESEIGYIFLNIEGEKTTYNILDNFSIIYSSNEHYKVFDRCKNFSIRTSKSLN
jgi:hypothetical protein